MATFAENWIADIEAAAEVVKQASLSNARSMTAEVQFAIDNILYWTKPTPTMTAAAATALERVAAFSELLTSRGQAALLNDPLIGDGRRHALEALKALQTAIPSDVAWSAEGEIMKTG